MDLQAELRAHGTSGDAAADSGPDSGGLSSVPSSVDVEDLQERDRIDAIDGVQNPSAFEPAPRPAGWIGSWARERRDLAFALLFSLLVHAVLLSLTFGRGGLWLPGSDVRWPDRRLEMPELRVVLVPASPVPERSTVGSLGSQSPSAAIDPPLPAQEAVARPAVPAPHRPGTAAP